MKPTWILMAVLVLGGCQSNEERERQKLQDAHKKSVEILRKMHEGADEARREFRFPDSKSKEPAKGDSK